MGNTIQIRISKNLATILCDLRKEIALNFKQRYGLEEITVPQTLSSEVLAAKLRGQKTMKFAINKTSLNKGLLTIL